MAWEPRNIASDELTRQLRRVAPSFRASIPIRPCLVHLTGGARHERVLFVREPHGMSGEIHLDDIERVEESPHRLPPGLATKLHAAGLTRDNASGGFFVYTLVHRSGRRFVVDSKGTPDFPALPEGVEAGDIIEAIPHEGIDELLRGECHGEAECLTCFFLPAG